MKWIRENKKQEKQLCLIRRQDIEIVDRNTHTEHTRLHIRSTAIKHVP